MCTNGSGTNSVKPPVSRWSSRTASRWRAQFRGPSTWPNMIVLFERRPDLVRGSVHLEPLRGRDLVRADDRADLVVEHLGGGARERGEPLVAEALEVVAQRDAERRGALPDLERAEGVDVQLGHGVLDRADDRDVVVAVEAGMDPALEADLGGAALPGLDGAPDDLRVRDEVGLAAQVRRELPLREGAEAAAEVADVRVLDVPGDDVGDRRRRSPRAGARRRRRRRAGAPRPRARKSRTISVLAELVARGDAAAGRGETTNGTSPVSPGDQASSRARPSESAARSTCGSTPGSIQSASMWPG